VARQRLSERATMAVTSQTRLGGALTAGSVSDGQVRTKQPCVEGELAPLSLERLRFRDHTETAMSGHEDGSGSLRARSR
jgi:hypothetical protein